MRKKLLLAIGFLVGIWGYVLVLGLPSHIGAAAPQAMAPDDGITPLFSPGGGCTDAIVAELAAATKSIDIQAYSFTSKPIADAVADAYDRGVHTRIILDKTQEAERASCANYLRGRHIQVYIDDQHSLAHSKIMLIDGKVLITGSFNFTKSSEEKNAENLLIIRNRPKLMAAYHENFEHHLSHSIPLADKAAK